jgi:hypothetical protein
MINDWYKHKGAKFKPFELAGSLSKEDAEALRRTAEEIREGIGARMKALINEGAEVLMPRTNRPQRTKGQGNLFKDRRSRCWQLNYWNGHRQVRQSARTEHRRKRLPSFASACLRARLFLWLFRRAGQNQRACSHSPTATTICWASTQNGREQL